MFATVGNSVGRAIFGFSGGVIPAIRAAIADAELHTVPFPHIIVPDILPEKVHRRLLSKWPETSRLPLEPGGIGRYLGHISGNSSNYGRYWAQFSRSILQNVLDGALARFAPYNEMRFGTGFRYLGNFGLFESGPTFTQHGPHTHYMHNPDWAMTFLLFIEDGDRTDRGEVLSVPSRTDPWIDIVSNRHVSLTPAKLIPFRPNTLLAWLDGPMSFHGTAKLAADSHNRRRMIRCHSSVPPAVLTRVMGVTTEEFFAACRRQYEGDSATLESILARPGCPANATPRFTFAEDMITLAPA